MTDRQIKAFKVALVWVTFLFCAPGYSSESPKSDWATGWLVRNILVRDYSAQLTLVEDGKVEEFLKTNKAQSSLARFGIVLNHSEKQFVSNLPDTILKPYKDATAKQKTKDVNALYKLAFNDEKERANIQDLLNDNTKLECKVTPLELRQYIEHQKSVVKETQHAYSSDLIKYVKLWKADRIKCLIKTLAEKFGQDAEYDYLALTATLNQFGYSEDPFFKKILATRYLLENNYAESLRNLFELQKIDDRFRNLYEMVQRQYIFVQKGQGEVSIKSL